MVEKTMNKLHTRRGIEQLLARVQGHVKSKKVFWRTAFGQVRILGIVEARSHPTNLVKGFYRWFGSR